MASWPGTNLQVEYLRRVRRLRGRYAHRPGELHRRIQALSAEGAGEVTERRATGTRVIRSRVVADRATTAAVPGVDRTRQEAFAELVESRIEAGVLRYSNRLALLAAGARMGLGRFEANLVIATVQHRVKTRGVEEVESKSRRYWPWMAFAAVQAGIVGAGVWWFWI